MLWEHSFFGEISKSICSMWLIIWCILLTFLVSYVAAVQNSVSNDTCWLQTNTNNSECYINAYLQTIAEENVPPLPIEIDCQIGEDFSHDISGRRFAQFTGITLDGCNTPAQILHTWGMEYLPHCSRITTVTLQNFNMHTAPSLNCARNETSIEILHIEYNVLHTVSATIFLHVQRTLAQLIISRNSIMQFEPYAFNSLSYLNILHVTDEWNLSIVSNYDIFLQTKIQNLHLINLKSVNAQLFTHLPFTLAALTLRNTTIDNATIYVHNPARLQNLSITYANLKHVYISELNSCTLLNLNLSHNALINLKVESVSNGIANIKSLDLSYNELNYLPLVLFASLPNLQLIFVHGNFLRTFSLTQLLNAVPHLVCIDLRENWLNSLANDNEDNEDNNEDVFEKKLYDERGKLVVNLDYLDVHLQVDNNAWNCKWLLHFAHMEPQKFRLFAYNKYISPMNINGLECNMENSTIVANYVHENVTTALPTTPNVTVNLLDYSSLWEKRNQRAEALFIVFMLPLGIACLFALLYIWIYCQKIFHMSTYRSCRWSNCHSGRGRVPADVVRHMPATQTVLSDGYEIPLSSSTMPLCACNNPNCSNCRKNSADNSLQLQTQFNQAINITYEKLPNEQPPYILYEEILGDDMPLGVDKTKSTYSTTTPPAITTNGQLGLSGLNANLIQHPIYDHLSYDLTSTDI